MEITTLSETQEEVLESIWKALEIGADSVSKIRSMCAVEFIDSDLDTLIQMNLIYEHGTSLALTEKGREYAEKIVRRHRIAEVLVISILKHKSSEMERIACEVEHSLQPEVEEAICTLLGHPEFCPDGKPIPKGTCCRNRINTISKTVVNLSELSTGEHGKVAYIKPESHSVLEQLLSFGLSPGVEITIVQVKPVYCIKFENTELALDKEIVKNVFVWPVTP